MPRGRKKKTAEPVVETQENVEVESVNDTPAEVNTPQVTEEWKEKGFASPEAYQKYKSKF